jgi:hypothetical protein
MQKNFPESTIKFLKNFIFSAGSNGKFSIIGGVHTPPHAPTFAAPVFDLIEYNSISIIQIKLYLDIMTSRIDIVFLFSHDKIMN